MRPGPRNLITDVTGLIVGNAQDEALKSGTTVLTSDRPFTTGVHVMGGAPGTRETDLLAPDKLVEQVDALVLSGGSAFGLDAASGVADAFRSAGRGFAVADQLVPIVPGAILFDLLNGGDKSWVENPYRALGVEAFGIASDAFLIGTEGAGTGATTATLKGGLGSASAMLDDGVTVGALVAVNAVGSATIGSDLSFWASDFELNSEFGGIPRERHNVSEYSSTKTLRHEATTIAIVATDAKLNQAECTRMAIAAHDGIARAIVPSHTPFDGDLVFACSHGNRDGDTTLIGHAAACCLARAIARGVYAAKPAEGDLLPCWSQIGS